MPVFVIDGSPAAFRTMSIVPFSNATEDSSLHRLVKVYIGRSLQKGSSRQMKMMYTGFRSEVMLIHRLHFVRMRAYHPLENTRPRVGRRDMMNAIGRDATT